MKHIPAVCLHASCFLQSSQHVFAHAPPYATGAQLRPWRRSCSETASGRLSKCCVHMFQEEPRPGQGSLGCRLWPLDRPLSMEHEVNLDVAPALPAPAKDAGAAVKWNARVRAQASKLWGCA